MDRDTAALRRCSITLATSLSLFGGLLSIPSAAGAEPRVPLTVIHHTQMGPHFRPVSMDYRIDDRWIYRAAAHDDEPRRIEIARPMLDPGEHLLTVRVVYRGHGRGAFAYLSGYRFTVQGTYRFHLSPGRPASLEVIASERGTASTPLEKRPAIEFRAHNAPEVQSARLQDSAPSRRASRRRRFGIGVAVAGPEPSWGYTGSYFASEHAIADLVCLANEDTLTFMLGVRLRGPRLPIIHPFVGTAVTVTHRFEDGEDHVTQNLALRAGFDVRFPGDRWILTGEIAARYPIAGNNTWQPAGTASLSYLFR